MDPTLWTTDEILANSQRLRHTFPGIYFLIRDGEIVYVGQSTCNILERIARHTRDKVFDSFTVIHMTSDVDLDRLEAEYVYQLNPEYNKTMPRNSPYASKATLASRYGLNTFQTDRLVAQASVVPSPGGYYDVREIEPYIKGIRQ